MIVQGGSGMLFELVGMVKPRTIFISYHMNDVELGNNKVSASLCSKLVSF